MIPAKYRNRAVLSPTEIAEVSPFSVRKIREMIGTGKMPSKLECGRRLVPAEWIWTWLGVEPSETNLELDPDLAQFRAQVR